MGQWKRSCLPMQESEEMWVPSLGRKDPLEGEMAICSSVIAWKIHRHRSLAGYSPSGQKELDTAEWLNMIINYTHHAAAAKSLQSGPTLCDPTEGSPPGFPIPGILQARTLEIKFPRLTHFVSEFVPLDHCCPFFPLSTFGSHLWQSVLCIFEVSVFCF